jgi:hypothetical protein
MLYRINEYASREHAFNKTLLLLKLLHVLIFKSFECLSLSLRTTSFTYKHTTRINKKQSSNSSEN